MQFKRRGFTLVELLISIGIIGILIAIGSTGYIRSGSRSRDARRRIDMQSIRSALEIYRSNNTNGTYPSTGQYPSTLISGGYIQTAPLDPSRIAYTYVAAPAGCNNVGVMCTNYALSIRLESTGLMYTVTPTSVN